MRGIRLWNLKTNLMTGDLTEESRVKMPTCRRWNRLRFWQEPFLIHRLSPPWPGSRVVSLGLALSIYSSNPSRTSRFL